MGQGNMYTLSQRVPTDVGEVLTCLCLPIVEYACYLLSTYTFWQRRVVRQAGTVDRLIVDRRVTFLGQLVHQCH